MTMINIGDDTTTERRPVDPSGAFEAQWKVSEMVNPDGSVTIRRTVRHWDGTRTTKEEEYSAENELIPVKTTEREESHSKSSEADVGIIPFHPSPIKSVDRSFSPNSEISESSNPPPIKLSDRMLSANTVDELISPRTNDSEGVINSMQSKPEKLFVETVESEPSRSPPRELQDQSISKDTLSYLIGADCEAHDESKPRPTDNINNRFEEEKQHRFAATNSAGDNSLSFSNPLKLSIATSGLDEPDSFIKYKTPKSVSFEGDPRGNDRFTTFDELWEEDDDHSDSKRIAKLDPPAAVSPGRWNEEKQHRFAAVEPSINTSSGSLPARVSPLSNETLGLNVIDRFDSRSTQITSPVDKLKVEDYESETSEVSDLYLQLTGKGQVRANREEDVSVPAPAPGKLSKPINERVRFVDDNDSIDEENEPPRLMMKRDNQEPSSPLLFTNSPRSAFRADFQSPFQIAAKSKEAINSEIVSTKQGESTIISPHTTEINASNNGGDKAAPGGGTLETFLHSQDRELGHPHQEYSVTLVKSSPTDKLGVHVGIRFTNEGDRLVITKISPKGLVANTAIEAGDIVSSINGFNFLENPDSGSAQEIVRSATEKITFVLYKAELLESLDDASSLSSFPQEKVSEMLNADMSKTVTRETWGEDGSLTVSKEELLGDGSFKSRKTRKKSVDADGTMMVFTDEESIGDSSSVVVSNEVINISGSMKITVTKRTRSEKVGLGLMVRKIHQGSVLCVSKIDPSGLFAKTPLRVGDIVLSINSFNFRINPDIHIALSIIGDIEEDLTIVARKSEESLQAFLRKRGAASRGHKVSEVKHIPAPERYGEAFEEVNDSLINEGNTTMSVTVTKSSPYDRVGISMITKRGESGTNLIVSKISPSSLLANSALCPGDRVLSINGVSFLENPDTDHAAAVIHNAPDVITIDYLRPPGSRQTLPSGNDGQNTRVTQTILPDGQKVVRTESVNYDGKKTVKIEEFRPPQRVHVPIRRSNSDVSGSASLDVSEITWWDAASLDGSFQRRSKERDGEAEGAVQRSMEANADHLKVGHIIPPVIVSKGSNVIKISATKRNPSQEIGISMETVNGTLCITKISPTGLFAGKPMLPGDTILSINGISFSDNPMVRDAMTLLHAEKTVEIEILKSGLKHFSDSGENTDGQKKKWNHRNLFGKKRKKFRKNLARSNSWLGGSSRQNSSNKTSAQNTRSSNSRTIY